MIGACGVNHTTVSALPFPNTIAYKLAYVNAAPSALRSSSVDTSRFSSRNLSKKNRSPQDQLGNIYVDMECTHDELGMLYLEIECMARRGVPWRVQIRVPTGVPS
jgi:hypothetical protein